MRAKIEKPPGLENRFKHIAGYELRQLRLEANSSYHGRTIRDLGIREEFGVIVVGLERDDRRIINPVSDFPLSWGDVLWIVGEKERLDRMFLQLVQTAART